jgi:cytoskeletal protein CcmA (bactofilin family)
MFESKQNMDNTTVVAEGVHVEGNFKGNGPMIIDGSVKGKVQTSQTLQVGEHAIIDASVKAGSALISGRVKGGVNVKELVELTATAIVEGDITTKLLIVAEGAVVNGKINMGATEPITFPNEKEEVNK